MKYADKIDKIVCVCSHDLLKFLTNMYVPGFYMGTCKCTDKSLSDPLIFASTKPQYDDRLFIELQVQYMKTPSSEHGENMLCTKIVLNVRNNFCTQHVLPRFELGIFDREKFLVIHRTRKLGIIVGWGLLLVGDS